jgi:hypothetical protein
MLGHHLLVGGNHVFTALDGLQDERPGRFLPANDFDDDVHARIVEDHAWVSDEREWWQLNGPSLVRVAHQDLADLDRAADTSLERVVLGQQYASDA